MPNYAQSLVFTPGLSQAWLRELTGREELAVAGTDLSEALGLIDRLQVAGHRAPVEAAQLAAPDRDRLLAAIYQHTYGDLIRGTIDCKGCEMRFDMDFSLQGFVAHTHGAIGTQALASTGTLDLGDGLHLRIPTGADELAVLGLPMDKAAEELTQRLLLGNDVGSEQAPAMERLDDALANGAPMLQADMAAQCPECGAVSHIHFDVQSYLLQSLLNDQERLGYEVHRLAKAYSWSLKEIMKLPRSRRRNLVYWIEAEYGTDGLG
jgi:hypothetical protein